MSGKPVLVLQQVECEGPGVFLDILERRDVPCRVVNLEKGDSIPDPGGFRSLIVLGGPMGVYDEDSFSFLRTEDLAIRSALRSRLPFLGVCLGGQLLAKALGARVKRNRVREVGFSEVVLTPRGLRDPLFEGLGERITVFQWHGDTFSIPRGGARLATSALCVNQAFRHGAGSYGLQFHVETTPEMIREWARRYQHELPQDWVEVVLPPDLDRKCELLRESAERMLSNFLRLNSNVSP